MSEPVFNFGLKLYNMQNINTLMDLLKMDRSLEAPRPSHLDQSYDHTEFELMNSLLGESALCGLASRVTRNQDEKIKAKGSPIEPKTSKLPDHPTLASQNRAIQRSKSHIPVIEATEDNESPSSGGFLKKLKDGFSSMIKKITK
jgi:hypothetical protein